MVKFEIQKKKFQQILKTHSEHAANYNVSNVLTNIQIAVKGNVLSFYSTDGNRLLRTRLKLDKEHKTFKALFPAGILQKLKFIKGNIDSCIDNIEVSITKKEMVIFDRINKFTYKIAATKTPVPYPKVEKLLKEYEHPENPYEIAFNVEYLSYLKNLNVNPRSNILQLCLNKENNLSAAYFKAENSSEDNMIQDGVIMPIRIR